MLKMCSTDPLHSLIFTSEHARLYTVEKLQLLSEYPVRARRLFDLIRKPAFQEALALRSGAIEVHAQELKRSGDYMKIIIERTDPRLDKHGHPKEGKTSISQVIQRWDLDRMDHRWEMKSQEGLGRLEAEGTVRIDVMGRDACRMSEEIFVTVKIPLFGKRIEQQIIERISEEHPTRVDFIMAQLGCD